MDAISLHAPGDLRLVTVPEPPDPGPGEALVATLRVGICGTDIAGYHGRAAFWKYPNIPGHELGVEVLATGPGVDHVRPGDRCAVEPYLNCGHCFACRRAKPNCCASLQVLGIMTAGGLRERFLLRADKLHPSPTLSPDALALVETLAIGCHAVGRAAPLPGDPVLVIGTGPIGLSVIEFARLAGARLTVMDRDASRLDFARRTYAPDHAILATGGEADAEQLLACTDGDRHATVFDATGNPASMAASFRLVAQGGTLVFVGLTTEEIRFPQPVFHRPEITLLASRNALPEEFRRILRLLETESIDTAPWISRHVDFRDLPKAFARVTDPAAGTVKAVVRLP